MKRIIQEVGSDKLIFARIAHCPKQQRAHRYVWLLKQVKNKLTDRCVCSDQDIKDMEEIMRDKAFIHVNVFDVDIY